MQLPVTMRLIPLPPSFWFTVMQKRNKNQLWFVQPETAVGQGGPRTAETWHSSLQWGRQGMEGLGEGSFNRNDSNAADLCQHHPVSRGARGVIPDRQGCAGRSPRCGRGYTSKPIPGQLQGTCYHTGYRTEPRHWHRFRLPLQCGRGPRPT